ncbi:MAG: hypothetical protein K2J25_06490, partial [Oscillospiraceae bacterium]|nr:hypothetical protein [Oscillospiraceae bacterium]
AEVNCRKSIALLRLWHSCQQCGLSTEANIASEFFGFTTPKILNLKIKINVPLKFLFQEHEYLIFIIAEFQAFVKGTDKRFLRIMQIS